MRTLCMGAVLWDIINGKEYIGGAPFNLAVHLSKLGAESAFLTRIGNDVRGERALDKIHRYGVSESFVQKDNQYMTGIAEVSFDEAGSPSYNIPHAAYDEISADDETVKKIKDFNPDVLCFGTIEQRTEKSRESFTKILKSIKARHVFFDVNIRMNFCDKEVIGYGLEHSTILKINEDECVILSKLIFGKEMNPSEFSGRLFEKYKLEIVIVTLGAKGCYVRWRKGEGQYKGESFGKGDSVGAGDAFSAAFVFAFASGISPAEAAACGNLLGGYVAGKRGALPEYDDNITKRLAEYLAK